ncbi:UNVERIFIED_CONTAM: hypothetical protein HDU68_007130 [Siphonaria sp. JEL0065]|nr:hypothetical protein HDU68_007130 [Siphonaria sp. JEL0065]
MPRSSPQEQTPLLGYFSPLIIEIHLPTFFQISLNFAVNAVSQFGIVPLASMALATLFVNVTGYSLIVGFGASIDTLCSQAYGEYLAGGQEGVGKGIMSSQMKIVVFVSPINFLLQYIFNFSRFRIGNEGEGAPVALTICHSLICVMLLLYARFIEGDDACGGYEWSAIRNYRKLSTAARLGVSGILMTCSEWWAYEVVALFAGILGPSYLVAQTILLSAASWAYTIPLGVSIASSTRIGNALGSGFPDNARVSAFVAVGFGFLIAGVNSGILVLCKNYFALLSQMMRL